DPERGLLAGLVHDPLTADAKRGEIALDLGDQRQVRAVADGVEGDELGKQAANAVGSWAWHVSFNRLRGGSARPARSLPMQLPDGQITLVAPVERSDIEERRQRNPGCCFAHPGYDFSRYASGKSHQYWVKASDQINSN